jgi:hypothetical protein
LRYSRATGRIENSGVGGLHKIQVLYVLGVEAEGPCQPIGERG